MLVLLLPVLVQLLTALLLILLLLLLLLSCPLLLLWMVVLLVLARVLPVCPDCCATGTASAARVDAEVHSANWKQLLAAMPSWKVSVAAEACALHHHHNYHSY